MPRKIIYQTEEERKKARMDSINDYHKRETICINVRFMKKRDATILEKLNSVESKTDYIRQLILKDIEENA